MTGIHGRSKRDHFCMPIHNCELYDTTECWSYSKAVGHGLRCVRSERTE